MHRAAAALVGAADPSEELGHDAVGFDATGEGVAVVAVVGDDLVVGAEGVDGADGASLLARVEVEEAADLAARVHLRALLLEAPDEQHLVEEALLDVTVGRFSDHGGDGLAHTHACGLSKVSMNPV